MKNNSSKYSYNDAPICPWCDHENGEWREYNFWSEDGSTEFIKCGSCKKNYLATIHIDYSFTTEAIRCKPHSLERVGNYHNRYECSKCHNEYYDFMLADGAFPKLKPDEYVIVGEK